MPFQGSIDEVAIYNTVFSDANVAAQDNPVPVSGLVTPVYDYRGNMTALNGDTYTYDAAGRHMTTVHGTTTVTYTRDATNAIVARADSAGTTTRYSGAAVLNTSNTVTERTITLAGGVMVTKRTASDVWSYPNIHGDVSAVCNATGVKQGATVGYDPYGNALAALVDNSAGNWDYGWVGQHSKGTEHATSVVINIEMGDRIYNPATGRFLSVDPVEGGTANDYNYVTDPLNQLDLTGTTTCDVETGACGEGLGAIVVAVAVAIAVGAEASFSALRRLFKSGLRGLNFHLHHIVAKAHTNADNAVSQRILRSVGIGINDPFNLVPLQPGFHANLHSAAYFRMVRNMLASAYARGRGGVAAAKARVSYALVSLGRALWTLGGFG